MENSVISPTCFAAPPIWLVLLEPHWRKYLHIISKTLGELYTRIMKALVILPPPDFIKLTSITILHADIKCLFSICFYFCFDNNNSMNYSKNITYHLL